MKKYERPVIIANSDLAEGVYAGSGGAECYTIDAYIHQKPQEGRGDYRIQLNAVHAANDNHHGSAQILTISFNQPVEYVSSNGSLAGGNNSAALVVNFSYHSNANDNIGLGELVVKSDPGLAITGSSLGCNYDCGQH